MTENQMIVTMTADQLSELVEAAVGKALEAAREREKTEIKQVYLTREQTMQFLQISSTTLWKLDNANLLEKKKIGRKVLYSRKSVEAAQTAKL